LQEMAEGAQGRDGGATVDEEEGRRRQAGARRQARAALPLLGLGHGRASGRDEAASSPCRRSPPWGRRSHALSLLAGGTAAARRTRPIRHRHPVESSMLSFAGFFKTLVDWRAIPRARAVAHSEVIQVY